MFKPLNCQNNVYTLMYILDYIILYIENKSNIRIIIPILPKTYLEIHYISGLLGDNLHKISHNLYRNHIIKAFLLGSQPETYQNIGVIGSWGRNKGRKVPILGQSIKGKGFTPTLLTFHQYPPIFG